MLLLCQVLLLCSTVITTFPLKCPSPQYWKASGVPLICTYTATSIINQNSLSRTNLSFFAKSLQRKESRLGSGCRFFECHKGCFSIICHNLIQCPSTVSKRALISFRSRNVQFFASSRKSRNCAEAYFCMPHKRFRQLTPRLRKRAISGRKLFPFARQHIKKLIGHKHLPFATNSFHFDLFFITDR